MSLATIPVLQPETHDDMLLLATWRRYEELSTGRRSTSSELAEVRDQLGVLLTLKQSELAGTGRDGHFNAWLRENNITRPTAYRLIKAHEQKKCLTETLLLFEPPAIQLRGDKLTMRVTPKQAIQFRGVAAYFERLADPQINVAQLLVSTLVIKTWGKEREELDRLSTRPSSDFTRADLAKLPPLVLSNNLHPVAAPGGRKNVAAAG